MARTKARANGDGDVFPRKNKAGKITSYRGAYVGSDGKRRYVSGKTKTEAREALATARANAAGGVVLDTGKLTVADYLERWLTDSLKPLVAAGKMAHSTFVRYSPGFAVLNPVYTGSVISIGLVVRDSVRELWINVQKFSLGCCNTLGWARYEI